MKKQGIKAFTKKECQGGYFLFLNIDYMGTDKTYFYVKEFIEGKDLKVAHLVRGFSFMTNMKSGTFLVFPDTSMVWWNGCSNAYMITKEEFQDAYDNAKKLADKKFLKTKI